MRVKVCVCVCEQALAVGNLAVQEVLRHVLRLSWLAVGWVLFTHTRDAPGHMVGWVGLQILVRCLVL